MKGIQKLVRLDIIAVRPYLSIKNFIIMIGLASYFAFLSKNLITVFQITQLFVILFSSYPFLVGEEAGLDSLYRVYGIKEKDVVLGRYISSVLFNILCMLMGIIICFVLSLFIKGNNIAENMAVVLPAIFIGTTLFIGLEYPFYFKYGYTKAKVIMMIVFMALGLMGILVSYMKSAFDLSYLKTHTLFFILITLSIWLAVMLVSVLLSLKWYREKELF